MKLRLLAFAAVAVVVGVVAGVLAAWAFRPEPVTKTVIAKPCGDRIFGHIASLKRQGDHFEMRFDPAWFTSGVTANTAAAEDGAVEAGQPVPNDNYVVDEGHRLLTYLVRPGAHVRVLTRNATGQLETPISVSELERIVNGGRHRPLFEPLDSGVWIRVHIDTACALEQQYRP
jgi:hypothetical protein